ncbi:MAG: radical SAM protein [Elusimicrobiota bacterium]
MDNKNITFIYKGRYTVRDTAAIEVLSAFAKQAGYKTGLVFDQDVFGVSDNVFYMPLLNKMLSRENGTIRRIIESGPDTVIYIDNFNTRGWAERVLMEAKSRKPDLKAVCITQSGYEGANFDYVLKGEPEIVFKRFIENDMNSNIETNELAALDKLPLPDKGLFRKYVNFGDSYLIYTSKGCRFSCSYCEEALHGEKYGAGYFRRRTPEHVILEMAAGKQRYGFKEVIFKDSVFTQDRAWLERFLYLYNKEIAVPFKCFGKVDGFDAGVALMLKNSGCYCVEFGVQTFNEKIRSGTLHRPETNAQILSAFSACDWAGLRYDADHMFGLPGESVEDHKLAAKIYSNCKMLNRVKCHNLVVYPDAGIGQYKHSDYVGDFFSTDNDESPMRYANSCFRKIFKLLPLLPSQTRELYWLFGLVPGIAVVAGQLLIALIKKDIRFKIYLNYYPRKVFSVFGS